MARTEDENAKFNAWLLTQGGARVTAVPKDTAWNLAVARAAADKITAQDDSRTPDTA